MAFTLLIYDEKSRRVSAVSSFFRHTVKKVGSRVLKGPRTGGDVKNKTFVVVVLFPLASYRCV